MKTITFYSAVLCLFLIFQVSFGQEEDYQKKIEALKVEKQRVIDAEKDALKDEVKEINIKLRKEEITESEADNLKKAAAEKRALNIENKVNILENQIALLERNESFLLIPDDFFENQVEFFGEEQELLGFQYRRSDFPKRDKRTHMNFVFALGILNNIIEDKPILELPHQILGSKSLELGLVWKTRVFKKSNWLRITYGISFQSNGLKTNNQLFVEQARPNVTLIPPVIILENANYVYGTNSGKLDKSKFRQEDLIFPIHFEFGPSKKREYRGIKGRDGRVFFKNDSELAARTYTLETSAKILEDVLKAQKKINEQKPAGEREVLITKEVLHEIRRLWRTERQDWDDLVPKIYWNIFGKNLDWKKDDDGFFNSEHRQILEEKCKEFGVTEEVLMKLLEAERQSLGHARRSKIHKRIEMILNEEWRSEDEILQEKETTKSSK